jgi:hypothetical protein
VCLFGFTHTSVQLVETPPLPGRRFAFQVSSAETERIN